MSIKILTKNSIDNTNIDGARQNHFSAGMRSGIVKGAFNEGRFFASASNVIALDSCELRISGHQIVIDSIEAITLNDRPSVPTKYSMIAEVQVDDISVPNFRLFIQPASVGLRQENLFKTNNGSGIYQLRIGNFTLGTTGLITDVVRTADIITGGGEGGIADIKFNATATQLSSSSQPEVNADYNEETKEWDLNFGIPAGGGSRVTIGGVEQPTWSADFAESERQKSKNLLVYPYTGEVYQHGVTFTDNGDGSFTINGKQTDTTANSYHYMETADIFKLSAGTYTLKAFADTSVTGWNLVLYDGKYYHEVSSPNITRTITLNEDKACSVYIQVPKASTTTFNNFVVKPILVKGTEVGEWQPYNGAIVHEKDIMKSEFTAGLLGSFTPVVNTYSKIPFNTFVASSGNKISLDTTTGEIKINDINVKRLKISWNFSVYGTYTVNLYVRVNRTSSGAMEPIAISNVAINENYSFGCSPRIIEVSNGERVYLEFYTNNNQVNLSGGRSYMTVEVVE